MCTGFGVLLALQEVQGSSNVTLPGGGGLQVTQLPCLVCW
jgi:hypothetical protein